MQVPDDGGGPFEGINPSLLAQLMRSLSSGVNNGQQLAGKYVWQFQRLGIDTGPVSKLQQDYGWAGGQQTMLQRRYNLASNQPSGSWEDGFAMVGASYLQWTSAAQAQAAGAQATKLYQDGKISYSEYIAMYEANQGDPDWSTGAVKALGQIGLDQLEEQLRDTYPQDNAGWQALATAVAEAMSNGVTFPYSDDPEGKGTENLQLLDPLVTLANFPASVLVALGNEVTGYGPNSDSITADNVLKALAANPEAAAQFMAQFQASHGGDSLATWIADGSDRHGMMPPDEAQLFANLIVAGTVGAKSVDPKLAAANATALVQFYADNPGKHTYGPIQAAYGKVVVGFWGDVTFAITSSAPGAPAQGLGPDGMHLSPDQWAAFIDEAMRDPSGAAMIMVQAHDQAQAWQTKAAQQPGGPNAGDSYAFQAGLVNGFFDSQAQTVYKSLGSDASSWKDKVADHVGDLVDVGFDVFADPGAAAKTVTVALTKVALEEIGKEFIGHLPSGDETPPKPDYSSWQGSYEYQVRQDFNQAQGQDLTKNPELASLVASAKSYDAGIFVEGDHIIDPAKMTPRQLQAYNAWLNSPAAMDYLENGGQGTSYRDGYQAWVTQNAFEH